MAGNWKDGAQAALALSFDFDAETLWLSRDPSNAKRPGTLSQGVYGAKVGVPLILKFLRERKLKATFFIPGAVIERYPALCRQIVAEGHEVGHHGYLHEWIDPGDPQREVDIMEKGLAALREVLGIKPVGYRSPAWETSDNTLKLLVEHGFRYSTNFMDDLKPYRHTVDGQRLDLVELPVAWVLDDAPFTLFSVKSPSRPIFPASQILEVWKEEFQGIYEYGGLCMLTMHPQFTGRPSRIAMLGSFLDYVSRFPNVWIANAAEIADWWLANRED